MTNSKEESLNLDNFTKPDVFLTKVRTLQESLPHVLDDYIKYHVLFNKDTTVDEYQNYYNNVKSNLQKLNSDLFVVTNYVEKNTESINSALIDLYPLIEGEKIKSQELKRKLGKVENEQSGSDEMISDFKDMYNLQYLTNFAMFGGIVVVLSLLFKVNKTNIPIV